MHGQVSACQVNVTPTRASVPFDCGCDQGLLYIIDNDFSKLSAEAKAVSVGITLAISALMTVNGC